ncbi:MAG: hypothetical protein LBP22_13560 [Deltaproteobacteria bacterium]|nr:hypothetical protein [Deltaproteobacteria bacterium]
MNKKSCLKKNFLIFDQLVIGTIIALSLSLSLTYLLIILYKTTSFFLFSSLQENRQDNQRPGHGLFFVHLKIMFVQNRPQQLSEVTASSGSDLASSWLIKPHSSKRSELRQLSLGQSDSGPAG